MYYNHYFGWKSFGCIYVCMYVSDKFQTENSNKQNRRKVIAIDEEIPFLMRKYT